MTQASDDSAISFLVTGCMPKALPQRRSPCLGAASLRRLVHGGHEACMFAEVQWAAAGPPLVVLPAELEPALPGILATARQPSVLVTKKP